MTRRRLTVRGAALLWLAASTPNLAQSAEAVPTQRTTHPEGFTTVSELSLGGERFPLPSPYRPISDRSGGILVEFDESLMAKPDSDEEAQVKLLLEVFVVRGGERTVLAPVDNYVSAQEAGKDQGKKLEYVFHEQDYAPGAGGDVVPDALINLRGLDLASVDHLHLRVSNLVTQEAVERYLMPRPFGFRTQVRDTLLFIRRQGVSDSEKSEGVDDFNFGPAPGVTYGGTFLPRNSRFGRALRPGVGISVIFTDWDDPSFDAATGQFVEGTESNDIEVGLGVQISLFDNVLHVVYGWNLNVDQDREYLGVGVSFVNMTSKLQGLLAGSKGGS